MRKIEEIDKNFAVKTSIEHDGIIFYDVLSEPFDIYGLIYENGRFVRMPRAVAASVSEEVAYLSKNTAGGRVRFRTDSKRILIRAEMDEIGRMNHFTLCGSAGFDLYEDGVYEVTYRPPYDMTDGYEGEHWAAEAKMRDVHINFPLYSNVKKLYIGLEEGCALEHGGGYGNLRPIVYYGSSITQGGCASRPGNSYEEIISRMLDCDYINLGFSGSTKGEDEIAEYISGLDMSVFVYDYDHNAPSEEHLRNTHEAMFKKIREKNPELPIIMVSRPIYDPEFDAEERRRIIRSTYNNAVSSGDTNVYFVDGGHFFDDFGGDMATVDKCHPNDLGFLCMAKSIAAVLERIL